MEITKSWKIKGLYKANVDKVYDEINSIGEKYSPKDIVDKAREENTELHKCFTWDDGIAAEKWREHEAVVLIANIVVKTTTSEGEPVAVRVISKTENQKEYAPTSVIVRNESSYADLLRRALAELQAFKQKYRMVSELHELFDVIDEIGQSEL